MELFLATPRGFCAGVVRAIEIVERALHLYGAPIYVKHEIVHNNYVVDDLAKKGAITLKNINEAPIGSTVIFSAHGSPPKDYKIAELIEIAMENKIDTEIDGKRKTKQMQTHIKSTDALS